MRYLTRLRIGAPLAVALCFFAAATGAPRPASGQRASRAAAGSCESVIFLGAAGSGELAQKNTYGGLGPELDTAATEIAVVLAKHGLHLARVADPYPADPVTDLEPTKAEEVALADSVLAPQEGARALASWARGVGKYFKSIKAGVSGAITVMRREVARCPGSSLVLAGYSQGAIVMHQTELRLASLGETNVLRHVAGTLLVGDGDRVSHTRAKDFGASPPSAEGIQTAFQHGVGSHDVLAPTTTADVCAPDDLVCDFNLPRLLKTRNATKIRAAFAYASRVHISYSSGRAGLLRSAAAWLADSVSSALTPCTPHLASVSPLQPAASQDVTVTGSCLGTHPALAQADGTILRISDETTSQSWNGCSTRDSPADQVTCTITSWTNNAIDFAGYSGPYGTGHWLLSSGDTVLIQVWNPQTGRGPATCTVIVGQPQPACNEAATDPSFLPTPAHPN